MYLQSAENSPPDESYNETHVTKLAVTIVVCVFLFYTSFAFRSLELSRVTKFTGRTFTVNGTR